MSARFDAALVYAAARRRALALNGKRPWFDDWPDRATTDRDEIGRWWRRWPESNVGLLCGHGLLVLDVDGDHARRELSRIEAAHGALPRTTIAATGRDGYGRHLYFAAPPDARSWKVWKGEHGQELAVRARRSQVVAPPSIHPDTGREYVWLDTSRLAVAPAWLLHVRRGRRARRCLLMRDPLRRVSAELYVPLLTGRELGRDRKVLCPLHDEQTPSLHVYADDGGWYCYGCERGGSIIDLAGALWGLDTRGRDYVEIRRRLVDLLLGVPA